MNKLTIVKTALVTLIVAAAGTAAAEETAGVERKLSDTPVLPQGFALKVGGGVTGYAKSEARNWLGTGPYWEARAHFGTRSYLGGEIAYVGAGRQLAAQGLDDDALMWSNGIETNGRFQLPLYTNGMQLTPFLFSGLGYQRLTVTNSEYNSSIVKSETNALVMPVGAGFSATYNGFIGEARFTYRRMIDDDTIKAPGAKDKVDLQNWAAGITIGYEI